jgi:hypothetical protein
MSRDPNVVPQPVAPRSLARDAASIHGHRSIANTVVYTAVADKRIRDIWGK